MNPPLYPADGWTVVLPGPELLGKILCIRVPESCGRSTDSRGIVGEAGALGQVGTGVVWPVRNSYGNLANVALGI